MLQVFMLTLPPNVRSSNLLKMNNYNIDNDYFVGENCFCQTQLSLGEGVEQMTSHPPALDPILWYANASKPPTNLVGYRPLH
jgi:hypothetical protein